MAPISSITFTSYTIMVLGFTSAALGHGDENVNMNSTYLTPGPGDHETYFRLEEFATLMRVHIFLMTISWVFILPVGLYSYLQTSKSERDES